MTPRRRNATYRERIVAYMHKAMREAKVYTSWLNPSERARAGDDALRRGRARARPTRRSATTSCEFQRRVAQLRHLQLAGAAGRQDRRARRARLLPGHRALGLQPRRSGQPAAGRLRAAARAAGGARRRSARATGARAVAPRLLARRATIASSCTPRPRCCGSGATQRDIFDSGGYDAVDVRGTRARPPLRLRPHAGDAAGDRRRAAAGRRRCSPDGRAAARRARLGRHACSMLPAAATTPGGITTC